MKLNVRAFAFACSLIWGLLILLVTWWVIFFDGASGEITWLGRIYRGYSLSPLGSLVGLLWALVDGLVFGALLAWLYNRFARQA